MGRFEGLPRELIDRILIYFAHDAQTLSRLIRVCKLTRNYAEPCLYGNDSFCNEAIFRSCDHGRPESLRCVAASRGAVESVVPHGCSDKTTRLSTLCLAIKRGHPNVVQQLLRLSVDCESMLKLAHDYHQVRNVIKLLISSRSITIFPILCRQLVNEQLDRCLDIVGGNVDNYHILLRLIKEDAPLDWIKPRLDSGDDPNRAGHIPGRKDMFSPLSLSVLLRQRDVFRLLLAYDAVIEGPDVRKPGLRALHLPTFAGAYVMALAKDFETYRSSRDMMRLCIEAGADINRRIPISSRLLHPIKGESNGQRQWIIWCQSIHASPLHVFLDTIESWRGGLRGQQFGERLEDLVSLGVRWQPRSEDELCLDIPCRDRGGKPPKHCIRGGLLLAPSALEFFVAKWHVTHVADIRGLREVVRSLVKSGAAKHDHSHLLARFTTRIHRNDRRIDDSITFARIIVADVAPDDPASKVLWQYLQDIRAENGTISRLGVVHYYVIKTLVQNLAADVNASFPEPWSRKQWLSRSNIYLFCRDVQRMERRRQGVRFWKPRRTHLQCNVLRTLKRYDVRVDSGADNDGALQALFKDKGKLNPNSIGYLQSLAGILQGDDTGKPTLFCYSEGKWIDAETRRPAEQECLCEDKCSCGSESCWFGSLELMIAPGRCQ